MNKNKGFLLVLEGCEGTGKSTVGHWLEEKLKSQGYSVFFTREPGGNNSKVAEKIRNIILDKENNVLPLTEAYLFAASRAQHTEEVIIPHLNNNEIVICDRFVYSSYAYQGKGRNLGIDRIKLINSFITDKIKPDLVLLFDLDPEIGLQRKHQSRQDFDRLDNEDLEFHKRVREAYLELAREEPNLIKLINASKSLEEVEREVLEIVKNKLQEVYYYE
ncbi:MAG: dTMP kinase [Minisyncoccia bacterium]